MDASENPIQHVSDTARSVSGLFLIHLESTNLHLFYFNNLYHLWTA